MLENIHAKAAPCMMRTIVQLHGSSASCMMSTLAAQVAAAAEKTRILPNRMTALLAV